MGVLSRVDFNEEKDYTELTRTLAEKIGNNSM